MASGHFEVRASVDPTARANGATPLCWPSAAGVTATVRSDLGWWLQEAGAVPDAAIDLARIAAGAYLADRLTVRPSSFTRTLDLTVALTDPDRWSGGAADSTADLLHWLTGDQWTLALVRDAVAERPPAADVDADSAPVSLLSGGLDSYLGALHLLHQSDQPRPRFLGHADTATAIVHAQTLLNGWLAGAYAPSPSYSRLRFTQAQGKGERSSRSRSLMFLALGTAAAAAHKAITLFIPENGYTSLNIPLHSNRGGALSTRSTHPETLHRMNQLLIALDVPVQVVNPFAHLTKGEQMRQVADQPPPDSWMKGAANTVSCGKLDGRTIQGGNPNLNCGLCYPCIVRRGAFIAADVPDGTVYLSQTLAGASRDQLLDKRRSDREAVAYATARGVDDDLIDASTWPDGYDLDQASDLVRRGLGELGAVPLM